MTREQLFEAMVGIDEERLEYSEKARKTFFVWILDRKMKQGRFRGRGRKKSLVWVQWGAAAVGMVLLGITGKWASVQFLQEAVQDLKSSVATGKTAESRVEEMESDFESGGGLPRAEVYFAESAEISENLEVLESLEDSESLKVSEFVEELQIEEKGFQINGVYYTPIRYEECQDYGLLGEEGEDFLKHLSEMEAEQQGLTEQQREGPSSAISSARKDSSFVGEKIGVIEECEDAALVGCIVYQYASYPVEDICIVKVGDSYKFYTSSRDGLGGRKE